MTQFIDILLHLDAHLYQLSMEYGIYLYPILALILFTETGLVFFPFLPGDSLLFAAGSLATTGALNLYYLLACLGFAVLLGDNINYGVGRLLGPFLLKSQFRHWIKPTHLEKTHQFYAHYGVSAILWGRFMPIIRTFVLFTAGLGKMSYPYYFALDCLGVTLWVGGLVMAGYFFGAIPFVKGHFSLIVFGIIVLSFAPAGFQYLSFLFKRKSAG